MGKFQNYIKRNWLPIVTNTQLVERWVKDSNECTYTGKDDHFASMIGLCRSSTVFDYKEYAKADFNQRALKGNRFTSGGKFGERIIKKTGQIESKKMRVKDVRGYHYTKVVIEKTMRRNEVLSNTANEDKRKLLRDKLTLKDNRFSQAREDETIERYAAILSNPVGASRNAIQSQSGFETTSHMKGEVTYSKLGKRHVSLVQQEIVFRGHTFDAKDGIRKLSQQLKTIDVERQKKHLIHTTGNENPDENLFNMKAYLPLHGNADVYGLH